MGDFLARYPNCKAKITIANTELLIEQTVDFKIDLCFVEGSAINSKINWENWLQDEMYCVCHPCYPLAQQHQTQGKLKLTDFNQQEWIIRELGSGSREHFNTYMLPLLTSYSLRLEFNQTEAIVAACRAGLGIGYLPKYSVLDELQRGTLYRLPCPITTVRQLRIGIHQNKYISPLIQTFHDFCLTWSLFS